MEKGVLSSRKQSRRTSFSSGRYPEKRDLLLRQQLLAGLPFNNKELIEYAFKEAEL